MAGIQPRGCVVGELLDFLVAAIEGTRMPLALKCGIVTVFPQSMQGPDWPA
jgi:hypothetical protein